MVDYENIRNAELGLIKRAMLKRSVTLRQYSLWLKTAETEGIASGPNGLDAAYARLEGFVQGLANDEETAGVDLIPGVGWQNLVALVHQVQQETGIDVGVCRHLVKDGNPTTGYSCGMKSGLLIGSLNCCLPPARTTCEHRPKDYWEQD